MVHISCEVISRRTDDELEAIDREENRSFRQVWSYTVGGVGGAAIIAAIILATLIVALAH